MTGGRISTPRYRSAEFERRSALYARLDAQLRDRTRFFAAAALINTAFARLFGLLSVVHAPCSFNFLNEVGAALEVDNIDYARSIANRTPGPALDHALVCAEQSQLQHHVRAHQARRPHQWEFIRHQLNGLLNQRYAASFTRWCHASEKIVRVLREVRGHVGRELEFGTEAHRVRIGLTLIEHIRNEA
ncbi:MAG: hypothetical protein M3O41_02480 [Pseudomonadota bacterium]|nr:hypothetical protein [Pseudomonadota bacterium]